MSSEIFWADDLGREIIWADANGNEIIWAQSGTPNYAAATFPPTGPTGILEVLGSYLYVQYNDDEDLQAFVAAYNSMSQQYVDFFNALNLPNYTQAPVQQALLDWVAEGIYGISRPSLPSNLSTQKGAFNTWTFNSIYFNESIRPQATTYYVTTDDIFRRIITWNFYKGDGHQFNIAWLKRRVMRFLFGTDGKDFPIDHTYRVSVSFGTGNQVNLTVTKQQSFFKPGSLFGGFQFNTQPFNSFTVTTIPFPAIQEAPILKAAIESGALQLPFQFDFVVSV